MSLLTQHRPTSDTSLKEKVTLKYKIKNERLQVK